MQERTCTIDGCEKPTHCRGWCPMHYQRWRTHGDVEMVSPRRGRSSGKPKRVGVEPCEVERCDKLKKARGWCAAHWSRWKRHGSPTAQLRGEVVDGKRICPGCQAPVRLEDWYVTPGGRVTRCLECFREWNRDRAHRRRSGVDGDRFSRQDVIERDGWMCALCGDVVDLSLAHPDPMSPTLDHVKPLSRGGLHTLANSQLAHRICNMRKWAHLQDET